MFSIQIHLKVPNIWNLENYILLSIIIFSLFQIEQTQAVLAFDHGERNTSGAGLLIGGAAVGRVRSCLKQGSGDGRMPSSAVFRGLPQRTGRNYGEWSGKWPSNTSVTSITSPTFRETSEVRRQWQPNAQRRRPSGPTATAETSGRWECETLTVPIQ